MRCVFPHSAPPGSAAADRGKNDGATVLEPLDDGIVGYARQISQAFVEGRVVKARQKVARHELVAAEFASMEMHTPDILWADRMRSQLIRRTGFRRGRDGCRC